MAPLKHLKSLSLQITVSACCHVSVVVVHQRIEVIKSRTMLIESVEPDLDIAANINLEIRCSSLVGVGNIWRTHGLYNRVMSLLLSRLAGRLVYPYKTKWYRNKRSTK